MRWSVITACALAIGALLLAPGRLAAEEDPLTDEDRADLAWFAALGYPSGAGKPFVKLLPGTNPEIRGFLLEDSDERIRVLGLGLREWSFEPSPAGTKEERRVRVETLRVTDLVEAWLHGGESPAGPVERFPELSTPSVQVRVLVLAHAMNEGKRASREAHLIHGMLAHARTLWHEHWRHYPTPDDLAKPLRERVAADLAATEVFRAKMNLVGTAWWGESIATDRKDQLAAFRKILERFPGEAIQAEVQGYVDVLERMIHEAGEHAATARPLEELEGAERIAELIFRLRDQVGGLGIMGGPGPIESGPYSDLVAIGLDAIPQLIGALGDTSLTRHGGEGRSGMSPNVSRVGDLALLAIQEIAGRPFHVPAGAWDEVTAQYRAGKRVAHSLACRPAIEEWYAEARAGGEVASLVRLVEAGDYGSAQAAQTLLEKDASVVADALAKGFAAAKDTYLRDEFLGLLLKHCGEAGIALIREEARSGNPWTRFTAAQLLADARDPIGTEVLLELWKVRRDGGGSRLTMPGSESHYDRETELRLITEDLLATGDAAIVAALGEDLGQRPALSRRVLVQALATARSGAEGAFQEALDAVLATSLEDLTEIQDEFGEQVLAPGLALRVRDVAAAALAARFELTAPRIEDPVWKRDALIVTIENAWAREHGIAEQPVPALPPVPDVAAEDLEAVLTAIADEAFGLPTRAKRVEELKAIGLAALPALRAGLAARRFGFARDIEGAVAELSFRVRAVRIQPDGAELAQPLKGALAKLEGATLTAAAIDDVFKAMLASAKKHHLGSSLDVYRGPGDDGVIVTLSLIGGRPGGWTFHTLGTLGNRFLDGGSGSGWSRRMPRPQETSVLKLARGVLAAQPGERAWLHARVRRSSGTGLR